MHRSNLSVKGTIDDPICIQDGGGFGDISLHLLDESRDGFEGLYPPKPPDQIDAHLLAVEITFEIYQIQFN
jgi:hypothetical protein